MKEMRELARKAAPFDSTKCEWFVEGFSQAWVKFEIESVTDSRVFPGLQSFQV